ncbi:MAG: hypothetical protein FJX29_14525 [Alphaproteobacteria bacterium]|nr:hypothetical protein [Alphaproteobacteria bacterium]
MAGLAASAGAILLGPAPGLAQEAAREEVDAPAGKLKLSASFGAGVKGAPSDVFWRVFHERARPDGSHDLAAESRNDSPEFNLAHGNYIVHASWGLAGASRRVAVFNDNVVQQIELRAGLLSVNALIGDREAPANRITVSVFVPENNNPEAKLVARGLRGGEVLRLPEGVYHIVSTYLDGGRPGSDDAGQPTNSVVDTEVRIQAGKQTIAALRHRAAQLTFKLVNTAGAEALANTSFTILTPGGDVIRELIGAFPSLILAEGEYVAIARNDGRTFQSTFRVETGSDRDVEILTRKE